MTIQRPKENKGVFLLSYNTDTLASGSRSWATWQTVTKARRNTWGPAFHRQPGTKHPEEEPGARHQTYVCRHVISRALSLRLTSLAVVICRIYLNTWVHWLSTATWIFLCLLLSLQEKGKTCSLICARLSPSFSLWGKRKGRLFSSPLLGFIYFLASLNSNAYCGCVFVVLSSLQI